MSEFAELKSSSTGSALSSNGNAPSEFESTQRGISSDKPRNEFAPGTLLNARYEIVKTVGKGGFGIVYEAVDKNDHDRRVAVKTLKHNIDDYELAQKRFEREIEFCKQLKSPHVVKIFDSGVADDDTLFYVMEFLEGRGLDERLAMRETFSFVDAKNLLLQVLDALTEAHQRGIVHRDIKPANIWLMPPPPDNPQKLFAKVLDFGIAKAIDDPSKQEKLTQTGTWMGSPAYMSPEQLRGGTISQSSDVFALGLVAIEMLTGYQTAEGESPMDVAMSIISPNEIFIEDWVLSSSLGNIFARCVKKDPTERYANAGELEAALSELDDQILINEFNAVKIRGLNRRGRSVTTQSIQPNPAAVATAVGLSLDDKKQLNRNIFLVGILILLITVVVVILLVKFLIGSDANKEGKDTQPAYITALSKGAMKGMGHGVYDPIRVEISISSVPAGATIYRASDNSEIGKTPLTVSPYAIPMSGPNVTWELVAKIDGFRDYPITIVPKMTTSPTMNIQMIPQRPLAGGAAPDGTGAPGAGANPPAPPAPAAEQPKDTKPEPEKVEPQPSKKTDSDADKKADSEPTKKAESDSKKKTDSDSKKKSDSKSSSKKTTTNNKKGSKVQSYDIDSMLGK
ncbi:MAG: serine/threonine protein kinase [Proteobacteria bacterium]|nr:serine/threonine protein kinase [Pseudomonadota bacterium]